MDDLSLLFQNKWSVGILIVSGLLIALAIGSSTIRGISQRQEEERARTNPPQTKGASSKAQLISGIIGAFIGVFLAFAVSGFSLQASNLEIGAWVGFFAGEIIGLIIEQTSSSNQP